MTVTAEHTHHWQAPEPCGHAEHPGKFINDWTDKERGAFLVGQKMAHAELARLRAELQAREATVLRMEAVVSAARAIYPLLEGYAWGEGKSGRSMTDAMERFYAAHRALDAVPRRAGTDPVHSHMGTAWCNVNGCTSPGEQWRTPAASPEPTAP